MTELAIKIHNLRNKGKTYDEIKYLLGCSKGTISYYIGLNQKVKTSNRQKLHRQKRHPFIKKIENFCTSYCSTTNKLPLHKAIKLIQLKIETFFYDRSNKNMYQKPTFTVNDVINKFGINPKCTLTGDLIDIYQPRTYEFDHIIPVSRGGLNTLDNLQICTKQANQAKRNLTDDEFVTLCSKIVKYRKAIGAGIEPAQDCSTLD